MGCWLFALILGGAVILGLWYTIQFGGAALVKRDRAQHLAILNEARRRSGKPPLTDADLPPEPDPLAESGIKIPKGFVITSPPPPPPPVVAPPPIPAAVQPARAAEPAGLITGTQAIVLLEDGFHVFSQSGLQTVVERAWGVVFPQGEDVAEWVRYAGPPAPAVIACAGYQFLVENAPRPYEGSKDGSLIGAAYRSVSIGANDLPPANAYGLLGKLAIELSSGSTLALYIPETGERYAFNPVTRKALGEDDPLQALRIATGAAPVQRSPSERSAAARARLAEVEGKPAHAAPPKPVLPVSGEIPLDDIPMATPVAKPAPTPGIPADVAHARREKSAAVSREAALSAAMREARRRFPELQAAFKESDAATRSDPFLIKSAFSDAVHTEYMWSEIVEISATHVIGILRSAPSQVTGYREGQDVVIPIEEVADWIAHRDGPGGSETFGNFTGPVLNG